MAYSNKDRMKNQLARRTQAAASTLRFPQVSDTMYETIIKKADWNPKFQSGIVDEALGRIICKTKNGDVNAVLLVFKMKMNGRHMRPSQEMGKINRG